MKDFSKGIDIKANRYPYCIVWTPLPLITALFPFIGHTGICTSEGIIHDFVGPYTISTDDMAFGNPTKYVILDVKKSVEWDTAIKAADNQYRKLVHNLVWNNCHTHVACALNNANFEGGGWNMVNIALLIMKKSAYTDFWGFFKSYIGFLLLMALLFYLFFYF